AFGEIRIEWSALKSRMLKRSVRYCVVLPESYSAPHSPKRYPVLYFLHGLGNNEQTLFNSGGWNVIQDLRQQHQIGEFLIVSPQAGGRFFINSAVGTKRYSVFFLQEFRPYIENDTTLHYERRT